MFSTFDYKKCFTLLTKVFCSKEICIGRYGKTLKIIVNNCPHSVETFLRQFKAYFICY